MQRLTNDVRKFVRHCRPLRSHARRDKWLFHRLLLTTADCVWINASCSDTISRSAMRNHRVSATRNEWNNNICPLSESCTYMKRWTGRINCSCVPPPLSVGTYSPTKTTMCNGRPSLLPCKVMHACFNTPFLWFFFHHIIWLSRN